MTEIPEDVMKAAKHQCDACGITPYSDMRVHAEYVAAFAIMAERERAAKVAECHSDDRPRRESMDWNDGYQDGCRGVAAAIRRGDV